MDSILINKRVYNAEHCRAVKEYMDKFENEWNDTVNVRVLGGLIFRLAPDNPFNASLYQECVEYHDRHCITGGGRRTNKFKSRKSRKSRKSMRS